MKILNKIVDNSAIVGYIVEDGTFILPLCKKALYLDMYIDPLIKEGYKYYSYDADTIEDPAGNPITELPEVLLSSLDELEWNASIDAADQMALTDADASRYYSFRDAAVLEFRREERYEINTRAELEEYLNSLERALYSANFSTDNRPINSFVNPEALFTIEELDNDPEVKRYFRIIIKRHRMRNYKSYQTLIKWLYDNAALKTMTPSVAEFLTAYYSWGPEGLKDKCTDYKLKLNVDGTFSFMKDPLYNGDSMGYMIANRDAKVSVVDGNNVLHFLKLKESIDSIADAQEFQRDRLAMASNDELLVLRRRNQNGMKYQAVPRTMLSDVSDRVYFTLVTESGYTYTYKIAHNAVKIGLTHTNTNSEVFSDGSNFCVMSISSQVRLPLTYLDNETDYYLWNVAILKSAQLMRRRSKDVPYSSTTEYLVADGVNPIATVDMMAHSIVKNNSFRVNRRYDLDVKDDELTTALDVYLREIPEYILNAYKISPEDIVDGMQSFLELADVDDLKDRREDMMSMRIGPNDIGFDPTYKDYQTKIGKQDAELAAAAAMVGRGEKMHDAVDYYTKVKFVDDCIHGNLSVDYFGEGKLDDMGSSFDISAGCMLSVVYSELGDNPDRRVAEQMIMDMDQSNLMNVESIFRMRDNAYKGYMVDFARYREMRASSNAWTWAYCTKVFRELSNAPIEKQRPYLMELVILENNKKDLPTRELMSACVKQAIEDAGLDKKKFDTDGMLSNWSEEAVALKSADYIGAKLFFYVLAGGVKGEPEGDAYKIEMNIQEGITLTVDLPVAVYNFVKAFNVDSHKRYITVYDYCKYEYNPNTKNGTFNLCLVNADIDPWHVKPKKGYNIKSYALMPNYHDAASLDQANGEGFYLQAKNSGGICVYPLRDRYWSEFIPYSTSEEISLYSDISKNAKSYNDMDEFLYPDQFEYIFAYMKRWALAKRHAQAMGKRLVSIPLKQDIVYREFAYSYCDELPPDECVYTDDVTFDHNMCNKVSDFTVISWKMFGNNLAIAQTRDVSIHQFSMMELDLNNISRCEDILVGRAEPDIPMIVSGNYLVIKDEQVMRVPVASLTRADVERFAEDGLVTQISDNKYFVRAINGDYVLEV